MTLCICRGTTWPWQGPSSACFNLHEPSRSRMSYVLAANAFALLSPDDPPSKSQSSNLHYDELAVAQTKFFKSRDCCQRTDSWE